MATLVLAGPAVAAFVAVLSALALSLRRGTALIPAAGVAAFGLAALYVVTKQWRNDYLVDFNWMNQFEVTHAWTLAAVALLVVDPVVERLRTTAPNSSPPAAVAADADPGSGPADGISADGE